MIVAHVMVKNEYQFIWYSVMSVIDHVDLLLLWDTGSTDGTRKIIDALLKTTVGKKKIAFREYKIKLFDEELVRQEMLDETKRLNLDSKTANWFIVVDGDEVWWESSIAQLVKTIKTNHLIESIVIPTKNTVGDIFHYQEDAAGNYTLAGRVGHYNLRAVNLDIPGLKSLGAHGVWGWVDNTETQIQDRDSKKVFFLDAPIMHCTFLQRSTNRKNDKDVLKRAHKLKHEIGIPFPLDFYYPEVFFRNRPEVVPSPWQVMSRSFVGRAYIETPFRKLKRRYLPKKIGY